MAYYHRTLTFWSIIPVFLLSGMSTLFAGQGIDAKTVTGDVLLLAQRERLPATTIQRDALTTPLQITLPPKRAMLIVIEENEAENFSVTWRGLSKSLLSFDYKQLVPGNILPLVEPVIDSTVRIAASLGLPAATLADNISANLNRQVSRMLGQQAALVATQAGLPAGGCARQMFATLEQRGVRTGMDPFKAFIDVYGEQAMADCLKAMAQPYYDTVSVLTDAQASFDNFRDELLRLHNTNHVIDVVLNLHGCGAKSGSKSSLNNLACGNRRLVFAGGRASPADIEGIKQSNAGRPLNINAVYSVACWGSEFNTAWRNLGAKAANGSRELNYYVLMSPFVFMDRFTRGNRTLLEASQDAYNAEGSFFSGRAFTARLDLQPFLNSTFPPPRIGIDLIGAACPGGQRSGCNWSFTPRYSAALNRVLSANYGHIKSQPVNHSASSARIQAGSGTVRRALVN